MTGIITTYLSLRLLVRSGFLNIYSSRNVPGSLPNTIPDSPTSPALLHFFRARLCREPYFARQRFPI